MAPSPIDPKKANTETTDAPRTSGRLSAKRNGESTLLPPVSDPERLLSKRGGQVRAAQATQEPAVPPANVTNVPVIPSQDISVPVAPSEGLAAPTTEPMIIDNAIPATIPTVRSPDVIALPSTSSEGSEDHDSDSDAEQWHEPEQIAAAAPSVQSRSRSEDLSSTDSTAHDDKRRHPNDRGEAVVSFREESRAAHITAELAAKFQTLVKENQRERFDQYFSDINRTRQAFGEALISEAALYHLGTLFDRLARNQGQDDLVQPIRDLLAENNIHDNIRYFPSEASIPLQDPNAVVQSIETHDYGDVRSSEASIPSQDPNTAVQSIETHDHGSVRSSEAPTGISPPYPGAVLLQRGEWTFDFDPGTGSRGRWQAKYVRRQGFGFQIMIELQSNKHHKLWVAANKLGKKKPEVEAELERGRIKKFEQVKTKYEAMEDIETLWIVGIAQAHRGDSKGWDREAMTHVQYCDKDAVNKLYWVTKTDFRRKFGQAEEKLTTFMEENAISVQPGPKTGHKKVPLPERTERSTEPTPQPNPQPVGRGQLLTPPTASASSVPRLTVESVGPSLGRSKDMTQNPTPSPSVEPQDSNAELRQEMKAMKAQQSELMLRMQALMALMQSQQGAHGSREAS